MEYPCKNAFLGYSDTSFTNNNDCTSISGYTFLASQGAITWGSKKQKSVSLSTTESEYIAFTTAARETIWLQNLYEPKFQLRR